MGLILNAWGPAGTLTSRSQLDVFQGNGEQSAAPNESAVGDRADLGTMSGHTVLTLKRYAGDLTAASGKRTEMGYTLDGGQTADWVDAEEEGADADEAYRWYRIRVKIPTSFPTDSLLTDSDFVILHQLHVRPDSNDAATSPALSVRIKRNGYGRLRFALVRNAVTDAQTVTNDNTEIASWPLRYDEWQDILTHVRWSYSSLGEMTVYRNRRPILSDTGANASNNAPSRGGGGQYPKIGVYTSADLDMVVHHCGLIIGDKDATFADMHPEDPDAIPLERVIGARRSTGGF